MADPAYTAARACVECGSNFEIIRAPGRPRLRCEKCVPRLISGEAQQVLRTCRDCGCVTEQECGWKPRQRCADCAAARIREKAKARWKPKPPRTGSCADCGHSVTTTKPGTLPKRCSPCAKRRNLARSYASRIQSETVCEGCGSAFRPKAADRKRFCSRECAYANRMGLPDPQEWPNSKVTFPSCLHCDEVFASRGGATLCGEACRSARQKKEYQARRPVHGERICVECDLAFAPNHGRKKTCSPLCARRRSRRLAKQTQVGRDRKNSRRKAEKLKRRAAVVEQVSLLRVLERDGWTCQICGCPTPRELRGTYEPDAPEVDHIIPIAKGGEHSYRNTQCACRRCNGLKSDAMPVAA